MKLEIAARRTNPQRTQPGAFARIHASSNATSPPRNFHPQPASRIPHPPPLQPSLPLPIAGFRYYDGAEILPELTAGTRLQLRPEPDNPHDASAVEIRHGRAKLGYIPRFCSRHIARLLDDGIPLTCEIERVDLTSPPWDAISIRIRAESEP